MTAFGGFRRWVVVEATLVPGTLRGDTECTGQVNRARCPRGGAPSPGPADPDAGARGGCPLIPGGPLFSSPAQTARTGCVLRGPFKRVVRIQGEEQEFFGKFKRTLYIVRDPT